jgi:hypothetical protein
MSIIDSAKGALDSFNAAIDRIQKAPLLIVTLGVLSYHTWRQMEWDAREERKDVMIQRANERKDSMANLYIVELGRHGTTKDSLTASAKREFQLLIENTYRR